MRNFFILLAACAACLAFARFSTNKTSASARSIADVKALTKRYGIGCSPNLSAINFADSTNMIPLLEGWGKYRMPVTTNSDSANIYFQQGINMYYGFHIIEALASFEKALKFDENFAMGYWGKALAYGPNINDIGYAASPEALSAMQKAKSL